MTTPPLPRPAPPGSSPHRPDDGAAPAVRRAEPLDEAVLGRLWPLFQHDLAEHRGVLPRPDATYRDERLRAALTSPGHQAWLLHLGEHPVGFLLVRPGAGGSSVIVSLFVVRGARGRGLGRLAVRTVTAAHPGAWEVAHQPENAPAAAFWPRVAAEVDPAGWAQEERAVPDLPPDAWVSFRSGAGVVDGRAAGRGATMAGGLRAPSAGARPGPGTTARPRTTRAAARDRSQDPAPAPAPRGRPPEPEETTCH